jgi:Protein of unknown function (DUF2599)
MRTRFPSRSLRRTVLALALAAGIAVPVTVSAGTASASTFTSAHLVSSASRNLPAQPSITYAVKAWWVKGPYGLTLRIDPSGAAQAIGPTAARGIWNNAWRLAGPPPHSLLKGATNSMFEQLECHLLWRFKTPYDLDAWRPSVSWVNEVYDECNPGYPHGTL